MRISIEQAAGQLTDLVRLAQNGEEVVLTENGEDKVRLERAKGFVVDPEERLRRIAVIQEDVRRKGASFQTSAARSQHFLYDDDGLPA